MASLKMAQRNDHHKMADDIGSTKATCTFNWNLELSIVQAQPPFSVALWASCSCPYVNASCESAKLHKKLPPNQLCEPPKWHLRAQISAAIPSTKNWIRKETIRKPLLWTMIRRNLICWANKWPRSEIGVIRSEQHGEWGTVTLAKSFRLKKCASENLRSSTISRRG